MAKKPAPAPKQTAEDTLADVRELVGKFDLDTLEEDNQAVVLKLREKLKL